MHSGKKYRYSAENAFGEVGFVIDRVAAAAGARRAGADKEDYGGMMFAIDPLIAAGVFASTAVMDAVYVLFTTAVVGRRGIWAANWSSLWYLLSAFAVINYTQHAIYIVFAAGGSWIGAFVSVHWLRGR